GLAAATTRLRLRTLVSPVNVSHPALRGKAVATADHNSGGRVELGTGAGSNLPEHRAYGFPFPPLRERTELLAEQLEIVHRQWKDERFGFHGRHFGPQNGHGLAKAGAKPHPPLA